MQSPTDSRQAGISLLGRRSDNQTSAPHRSEIEQLNDAVELLEKRINELFCALEPVLLRPIPQERNAPIADAKPTSPLLELIRDAKNKINSIAQSVNELVDRVRC